MSTPALLTLSALVAIDPAFKAQVDMPPQPVVKPLKPHQMKRKQVEADVSANQVRRLNQPAQRCATVRNVPCQHK